MSFCFGAGDEARTRFPASREWPAAIHRNPASPRFCMRASRAGGGSEFRFLTKKAGHPFLDVLLCSGAGDEARTRYLHLGKVALYQMSYTRKRQTLL